MNKIVFQIYQKKNVSTAEKMFIHKF